jgi:hypothetical protein
MNRHMAWMLVAGLAAVAATGCETYHNLVDPCWPARYNYTARREVVEAFAPQVQNGHILDQTIWNYDFEKGTDQLNPMGFAKLDNLVQRRPQPDPNIYLATARDVRFDPANPEAYGEGRKELDSKRVAAVQKYLQAQMVGRPMQFEVMLHDPFEVGLPGEAAALAIRQNNLGASGTLAGAAAAGTPSSAGAPTGQPIVTYQPGGAANQSGTGPTTSGGGTIAPR